MNLQEKIAAATIAQIFGSELKSAEQSAIDKDGRKAHFQITDPRSILQNGGMNQPSQQRREMTEGERRMLMEAQRQAELAHPYTEQHAPPAEQPAMQSPLPVAPPLSTSFSSPIPLTGDVAERLCVALERIATKLEQVDIQVTKKKTTRKKRPLTSQRSSAKMEE